MPELYACVGDFRQSLAFLHVSHLPLLYILVLEVGYLLHTRPSGVLGVSERHSSDAYRHSDGTQWLNCRGFPSVAGVSACLAFTCTLHTGAGSAVPSAHTAPRCDCGVCRTQPWRLSALRQHPAGPQCPNCRGFPSVAGVSACLASATALHIY